MPYFLCFEKSGAELNDLPTPRVKLWAQWNFSKLFRKNKTTTTKKYDQIEQGTCNIKHNVFWNDNRTDSGAALFKKLGPGVSKEIT